jgi:protease IV
MKRFFLSLFAAVGAAVVFGFVALLLLALALGGGGPKSLPGSMILELDLTAGLLEAPPGDPLSLALERGRPTVEQVVGGLHRAAEDDRVLGLRVVGGVGAGGWALTEELRDAVLHFRASGKPTLLFAETFGELEPSQSAYHLATAFDRIVLQPSGDLGLTGISLESPFIREALDRWGIEPRFEARGEYKDAASIFTEQGFSASSRESLEAVLRGLRGRLIQGMVEGRGLSSDSAATLLARGPFGAVEALQVGLVDALAYRDEAWEGFAVELSEGRRGGAEVLSLRRYREVAGSPWDKGAQIALVYGTGAIARGGSPGFDPLGGGSTMAANAVANAIREASEDPRTRALIFRVESPGGSYVASDIIRREVIRARERGIPVVVSMGNLAASGGYLVSAPADRIVAHPTTLTGSIGVVAGRFVAESFLSDLGVTFDAVDLGDAHPFFRAGGEWSAESALFLRRQVDRIYDDFVGIVAEGRGMDRARVEPVARGRVWTGEDAMAAGLVDALGGLPTAVAEARLLAGLESDAPVALRRFPGERSLFEWLLEERRAGGAALPLSEGLAQLSRGALRVLLLLGGGESSGGTEVRMTPLFLSER